MNIEYFHVNGKDNRKRIKAIYFCKKCSNKTETHKYNISENFAFICRPCNNKLQGKKRRGIGSKKKGKTFLKFQGKNSANWNGGKYINSTGYVMVLVKHGSVDRKSGWENYRPEHIVVMQKIIKRKLRKKECVHHIDGNRKHNKRKNLVLLKSHNHHRKVHMSLQRIGYELYKSGRIRFNRDKNEYELV